MDAAQTSDRQTSWPGEAPLSGCCLYLFRVHAKISYLEWLVGAS